jgi:hypothetical protein
VALQWRGSVPELRPGGIGPPRRAAPPPPLAAFAPPGIAPMLVMLLSFWLATNVALLFVSVLLAGRPSLAATHGQFVAKQVSRGPAGSS